jgi:probable phosphoglycerate mutase
MILYIIRHGEPNYKLDCLTELGWRQAEAAGRRMAKIGLDRIYASPMGRAQQTASCSCKLLGLECHTEDWAHEIGEEKSTPFPDGKMKSVSLLQNTYLRENGAMDLGYYRAY